VEIIMKSKLLLAVSALSLALPAARAGAQKATGEEEAGSHEASAEKSRDQ
jgi:hypothetical protein